MKTNLEALKAQLSHLIPKFQLPTRGRMSCNQGSIQRNQRVIVSCLSTK